jgi:hypothetical protein
MAKEQNLPLNPQKISGICGRLMCCLSYENQTYREINRSLPRENSYITTAKGRAKVLKIYTLKGEMLLMYENESIERVKCDDPDGTKPACGGCCKSDGQGQGAGGSSSCGCGEEKAPREGQREDLREGQRRDERPRQEAPAVPAQPATVEQPKQSEPQQRAPEKPAPEAPSLQPQQPDTKQNPPKQGGGKSFFSKR